MMAASADEEKCYLLLLPPCIPATYTNSKTIYGQSVTEVLEHLAASIDDRKHISLDIAIACPHLVGTSQLLRKDVYAQTQKLVAAVYKLVCMIAADKSINIEDAQGIDVRVLLLAWSPEQHQQHGHDHHHAKHADHHHDAARTSMIWTLEQLAKCKRYWVTAFGDESEQGEALLQDFTKARADEYSCQCQEIGHPHPASHPATSLSSESQLQADSVICKVAVGGTFDHLHAGHKLLLTMTAFTVDDSVGANNDLERRIVIGISGDELLKSKKHVDFLQTWNERQDAIARFLQTVLASGSDEEVRRTELSEPGRAVHYSYSDGLIVECVEIHDPYGPTITDVDIQGLVLSGETRAGGKAINDKRVEKGWQTLNVLEVDVLDAEEEANGTKDTPDQKQEFRSKLSSTAIREKLSRTAAG